MRRADSTWLNFSLAGFVLAASALTGCDDDTGKGVGSGTAGINGGSAGSGASGGTGGAAPHDGGVGSTTGSGPGSTGWGTPDASVPPDGGEACCLAFPVCNADEETYETQDACEAAGDGCRENSICCSTVYCRPTGCDGEVGETCDPEGYCYPLESGQLCSGERGSCSEGARPIPADEPCPEGHACGDEADGQRCAMRLYEDVADCEAEGDFAYATPAIGALVPCDDGDATLGAIMGFEPSLCCLDNDGNQGAPAGCQAMDARGVGLCEAFWGYAWDGSSCVGVSGCSCEGSDCGQTFDSPYDCQDVYMKAGCLDPDCRTTGCDAGLTCDVCWSGYACIPDGAVC